jgi:hypothetical protein
MKKIIKESDNNIKNIYTENILKKVNVINKNTIRFRESITKIVIPDNVTSIG